MGDRDQSNDAPVPLSRLRAKLAGPRGYRKLEALISRPDAASAVAALPVSDLYSLIKEVGFSDSQELVGLATAEQLRGCLDLDLWDRDLLQMEAALPWLAAILEAGFDKTKQVWQTLDQELAALLIQRSTRIYDLTLEEDPEGEERPTFTTPDTFFAIALTVEDDQTQRLIQRLVEDLYRSDMELARHTIMAARSEPAAELEEMSYRWRSGRMADLGYVDFYEALEVFRPIDSASVSIGEGTEDRFPSAASGEEAPASGELPVPFAERLVGRSFLARAVGEIADPDEAARLETALVVLANRVLAAFRVQPSDSDGIAAATDYAMATLALGLEVVSQGNIEHAAAALRTVSLSRIHRLGYTTTLRLARFAHLISPRAVAASDPASSVLAALLRARPWLAGELSDPARPGELRPFESLDDVRRAAEFLTGLALTIAVVDALGVDVLASGEMPEPRPSLEAYIRTALVRAMAGGDLATAPLQHSEVERFRERATAGGVLSPAARTRAAEQLYEALDAANVTNGREHLPSLLDTWLGEIEENLAGLPADLEIDPRFVDCVLLQADKA